MNPDEWRCRCCRCEMHETRRKRGRAVPSHDGHGWSMRATNQPKSPRMFVSGALKQKGGVKRVFLEREVQKRELPALREALQDGPIHQTLLWRRQAS